MILHKGQFLHISKVWGQGHQRTGVLQPLPNEEIQCLQIYFVSNSKHLTEKRIQANKDIDSDIIWNIKYMLHKKNSYVKRFKYTLDTDPWPEMRVKRESEKRLLGVHCDTVHLSCKELATIIRGEQTWCHRDIILHKRDNQINYNWTSLHR